MPDRVRNLLRKAGFEVYRYSVQTSSGAQLDRLLKYCRIDLVVDVGANSGHYALELRANGYSGRIVSFEPLAAPHSKLEEAARGDADWEVAPRMALGDVDGKIAIHVAGNSLSSSILDMLPEHERAAPGSGYVATETVPLHRLDTVAAKHFADSRRTLLKIDTQGYEDRVITGAEKVLDRVIAIQAEMSLVPLYAGQPLMDEMRDRIARLGYELFAVFPGYVHAETGATLQLDGYFLRRDFVTGNSR